MTRPYQLNQIKLICAITSEMERQCPGIPVDKRMSTVIAAATSIVNEYARVPVMASPNMGLKAWLSSDDTGASSCFMAQILSGLMQPNQHGDYPRDADDLGRCIRLLEAVPELVDRLERLKQCGPFWHLVVTNWCHWESLYRAEQFAELYDEMHLAYGCVSL